MRPGITQALRHMQAMEDKPELLVTGRDHVMDSFSVKIKSQPMSLIW